MRKTAGAAKVIGRTLSLVAFAAAFPAAGGQRGEVVFLNVRGDGLIVFELAGVRGNKPACATYDYWIIPDEDSERGKRMFAMLLAARASGAQVGIDGGGTCTRWGDGEDVRVVSY